MIADIGQQQWSHTTFRLSDRTLFLKSFHRNWWKYTRPPIILISAYILTCRADTSSRYRTGEIPPIKAGQPVLCPHLGSAWERGNISTRIWTRALQPVQEEVSSWRFRRALTVSGPPTFSSSADFSPGAGISMPAKILSSAYISARRQYFPNPPIFLWGANILRICLFFCESPIFWESAYFSMRRQYFKNPLIFRKARGICEFAWFCCCKYLCIFSVPVFIYAFKYAPIFLAQLF